MIQYWHDINTDMELVINRMSAQSYPTHNHVSAFVIGMLLEGEVQMKIGAEKRGYSAGDSFAILPYVPHEIQAQKPYTILNFCIQKERITETGRVRIREDALAMLRAVPIAENASKIQEAIKDGIGADEMSENVLVQIEKALDSALGLYCRMTQEKVEADNADSELLYRVRKRLELYPEEKLSIDEMAESAFASKYYFIRAFKKLFGLTPHQFQIQNRIRKAKKLLQSSSLTEAALDTGFCDQSHFIRQFEKAVGITPSSYKKAYKEGAFNKETLF